MGVACRAVGEGREVYRVLVGKSEVKKPLGRTRHRWGTILNLSTRNLMWGYGLDKAGSGWRQVGAFVNAVMNVRVL
jgi:hypothetical protein